MARDTISPALRAAVERLPASPGVYLFRDAAGTIIYVGKAKALRTRVAQYFQDARPADPKTRVLVGKIADLEWVVTDSEVEALILENTLIKQHHPRYNVMLRDDKTYPYIRITNEPVPRVFPTRKVIRDGSRYFGPYTDAKYIRYLLRTLRQIFPVRSCNWYLDQDAVDRRKVKLCLDYHIHKCEGPCEGLVSIAAYQAMIAQVEKFLRGRTREVERIFEEQMQAFAADLKFEEAARARNRLALVREYEDRQKMVTEDAADRDVLAEAHERDDACAVVFAVREGKLVGRQQYFLTGVEGQDTAETLRLVIQRHYEDADDVPPEILLPEALEDAAALTEWLVRRGRTREHGAPVFVVPKIGDKAKLVHLAAANARYLLDDLKLRRMKRAADAPRSVLALQKDLRLEETPRRMECFDISHFQGSETVASMVVFENGRPKKSAYRKYKIRTVEGIDDFKSMQEVIRRRYTRAINEGDELPGLIVVDGGKGQLSHALEVLHELQLDDVPIIGLAKRLEEVFVPGMSDALGIPKTSPSIHLLQRIRDEAHRFAITFHRLLRDKRTLRSELEEIAGVGPKTVKHLLDAFGSVRGVRDASMEQLVAAIGAAKATAVRNHFDTAVLRTEETAVDATAELVEEIT